MTRGVTTFTEQEKERALAIIRNNLQAPLPDLERRIPNIPSTTLARWRKQMQEGADQKLETDSESNEKAKPLTDKQRLQALEEQNATLLRTINVQNIENFYLRRYAAAGDDGQRKDIEIEYLMALLVEYGLDNPRRLASEMPSEDSQESTEA